MKRSLSALLVLLLSATCAGAASTINPNVPAQNSTLSSAVVRNNFLAAYNDVTKILGKYAGSSAPGNPVNLQDWVDTTTSPTYVFKIYNQQTATWTSYAKLNISTGVYTPIFSSGAFAATAPLTVSVSGGGVVTYALSYSSNFSVNVSNQLALASIASGHLVANCTGSTSEPTDCSWSSFADRAVGNTNGMFPYRTGGAWGTISTGTSGAAIPRLDTANTWGALQTFPSPSFTGTANGVNMTLSGALTVTGSFTATGLVTNASLANPAMTINGTSCTLGASCTVTAAAGSIVVGTTTITGGATTRILYDNAGVLGEYTITGTGTVVAMANSPVFTTPNIGAATATTINGLTLTPNTGTLTLNTNTLALAGAGVTLVLSGTAGSTTHVFPSTSSTLARTDAGQTFTGTQVFSGAVQAATVAINGCSVAGGVFCASGNVFISSGVIQSSSTSSSALAVGPNGSTNPSLQVDASTASAATGIKITAFAATGGVNLSTISSGTNENLGIDAKGSGTITLGGNSTGAITLTRATIHTGTTSPSSAAGNSVVMGTVAAPTLSHNGQAFLYNTTANGAVMQGAGSTYDVVLANKTGSVAIGIATGTQVPVLPGIAAGTCTNGLAVDASSNIVKIACPGAASSIQVGGTTITSGTAGKCLVNDNGTLGNVQCALLTPQGRLTLQSGVPVQTTDQTAKSQIFYTCYNGGNLVWVWNGTQDVQLAIGSCEISLTMATSGTGVTNSGGVFDIWAVNVSSALVICVATNGSGGGWASDTGGSNTARGTGYSQLDKTTRPYITNANAITNCYTGATDRGSISANRATYLGTLYTTAAGQTGVALRPTGAAGGANNVVGLSNGYNRVKYSALNRDTTASWALASTTWRRANNNTNNKITFVDGLQTSPVDCRYWASPSPASTGTGIGVEIGCQLDWSSGAPDEGVASYVNGASTTTVAVTPVSVGNYYPQIGVHTIDAVEAGYTSSSVNIFASGWGSTAGQMQGLVLESWY